MPHLLLDHVIPLLHRYGYAVILPIAVVEGPGMAMVAGGLVATGQLDAVEAAVLLILADLVGDAGYYGLGRFANTPLLHRIGGWLRLTPERMGPIEKGFRAHDWKFLMLGKTQAFGSVILAFAGAIRMSFLRFIALNAAGTIPKVILFEAIGYFFGRSIIHSLKYVDYATAALFGAALLLLVGYWLLRRRITSDLAKDMSD
jgi:membrane-associated protein